MLAVDESGDALTGFHRVAEEVRFNDAPLTVALVAVWHEDRLLVAFNRRRRCWELPGGMIDPGETPRQAAVRELQEETGLVVPQVSFVGQARFVLHPDWRVEYAALYTANVVAPGDDFTPNEEISAIRWWDGTPLPGRVHPLDAYLGRLTHRTLREDP